MDIREIQALHARYSSQPVVIDINCHVRALPAPVSQESTRDRVAARLTSACRRYGRPTAIAVALALGAGVTGMCAAKLWHVLHTPQAAALVEPTSTQSTAAAPTHATAASAPSGLKRPLTGADFAESAERTAASLPHVNAEALVASEPPGTPAPPKPSTHAAPSDLEKAAASPVRASRTAAATTAGQQPAASAPTPASPASSAAVSTAGAAPAVQSAAQPKAPPHHIHRAAARQRQDVASAEAPAPATHADPAKVEQAPKPATPAKVGDVSLF